MQPPEKPKPPPTPWPWGEPFWVWFQWMMVQGFLLCGALWMGWKACQWVK